MASCCARLPHWWEYKPGIRSPLRKVRATESSKTPRKQDLGPQIQPDLTSLSQLCKPVNKFLLVFFFVLWLVSCFLESSSQFGFLPLVACGFMTNTITSIGAEPEGGFISSPWHPCALHLSGETKMAQWSDLSRILSWQMQSHCVSPAVPEPKAWAGLRGHLPQGLVLS